MPGTLVAYARFLEVRQRRLARAQFTQSPVDATTEPRPVEPLTVTREFRHERRRARSVVDTPRPVSES